MTGIVRNRSTGQAVSSAQIEIIQGVNLGRTASSDSNGTYTLTRLDGGAMQVRVTAANYTNYQIDVPLSGNLTLNFDLAPNPLSLYFGYVTDGQGRPVVGARVRGGPDFGYTDANGRYEFQGYTGGSAGTVYPPDGYEPKPVRIYDTFPLYPGGQNITIRRITNVSMSPPVTLAVDAHNWVYAQVSFDAGKTESPVADLFVMTSSDPGVVKVGSGNGQGPAFVEGIKAGTASVSGRYFGISTATFQVQVVP